MDMINLRDAALKQINAMPLNKTVTVDAFITARVYNEYGEIIQEVSQPAESWTRGFLDNLGTQLDSKTNRQMTNMSGVTINSGNVLATNFNYLAGESDDSFGIQVGFSGIAVTISDFAMGSKIRHGTTSGRLYYGATSTLDVTADAPSAYLQFTRAFINQSQFDMPINEAGMVADCGTPARSNLHIHDAISTITVPSGLTGSITYTIRVTV